MMYTLFRGVLGPRRCREVGLDEGPLGIGEVGLWYALLMLGRVLSYSLRTPFRTVSSTHFSE
jgi:hypothetical protein